ncbi:MAG TPA: YdcF family protein, partial [Stenomitos sp.]
KEKGIPDQAIDGENCSLTTEENAIFSAAILQPQGVKKIILVTDEPHMLRTLLAFRAYGFTVFPRISAIPEHWNNKEKGFLKLRELLGVIKYGLRGAFFERPLSDLNRPELKMMLEEAKQYAQKQL